MKLGVFYNLFDCEELLETSILSIRKEAQHVCVVYQTVSNFNEKASSHLEDLLYDLKGKGLIDSIICYKPRIYTQAEKNDLISDIARPEELGGSKEGISDQFFNELTKRELGRLDCLKNGMTHFIAMDCDEYYLQRDIVEAKKVILANGYESTACRMRIFGKLPTVEYLIDDFNAVPFIHICALDKPFKLATPYPYRENGKLFALDPTRRIEGVDHSKYFHFFPREEVVMYHMTLVRKDIKKKLRNVSNRGNYGDLSSFWEKWDKWTPESGTVIHPHPYISKYFTSIQIVPNYFNIDFSKQCKVCCISSNLQRCSICKKAKYCSTECQNEDWPKHKKECKKPSENE